MKSLKSRLRRQDASGPASSSAAATASAVSPAAPARPALPALPSREPWGPVLGSARRPPQPSLSRPTPLAWGLLAGAGRRRGDPGTLPVAGPAQHPPLTSSSPSSWEKPGRCGIKWAPSSIPAFWVPPYARRPWPFLSPRIGPAPHSRSVGPGWRGPDGGIAPRSPGGLGSGPRAGSRLSAPSLGSTRRLAGRGLGGGIVCWLPSLYHRENLISEGGGRNRASMHTKPRGW